MAGYKTLTDDIYSPYIDFVYFGKKYQALISPLELLEYIPRRYFAKFFKELVRKRKFFSQGILWKAKIIQN